MFVVTVVLSGLAAAVFLYSGVRKLPASPAVAGEARHLGLPPAGYRTIGLLETAAAAGLVAGLLWAPLGVAAAGGLVLLMLGAAATHLRVRDPFAMTAAAVGIGVLAAATLVARVLSS